MVSEKVIVLLLVVAIVLSVVSVVITFTVNLDELKPQPRIIEQRTPDAGVGNVQLVIEGSENETS